MILTLQTRKLWWGWLGNLSKGIEPVSEEPMSDHLQESFIASSTSLQPHKRVGVAGRCSEDQQLVLVWTFG